MVKSRRLLCLAGQQVQDLASLYVSNTVTFARTLAEAREALLNRFYDLTLVDVDAVPEDGSRLLHMIRLLRPWMPVAIFGKPGPGGAAPWGLESVVWHSRAEVAPVIQSVIEHQLIESESARGQHCIAPRYCHMQPFADLSRWGDDLVQQLAYPVAAADQLAERIARALPELIVGHLDLSLNRLAVRAAVPMDKPALERCAKACAVLGDVMGVGKIDDAKLQVELMTMRGTGVPEGPVSILAAVPVLNQEALLGVIVLLEPPRPSEAPPLRRTMLMLMAERLQESAGLANRLRAQVATDPLTGLHNHAYLETCLQGLEDHVRRSDKRFAIILLDVDRFAEINNTFGHAMGNEVLRDLGQRIRSLLRPGDVAVRYGGDEILCVLREVTPDSTRRWAQALQATVTEAPVKHFGLSLHFTVSAGFAISRTMNERDTWHLVELADKALTTAKLSGRNTAIDARDVAARQANMADSGTMTSASDDEVAAPVLVVDDEPAVHSVVQRMLAGAGIESRVFERAEDVLAFALRHPQDLGVLVTDINMPEISGFDLIDSLRTYRSDIVPIVITGVPSPEHTLAALKRGVFDLLPKPFSAQDVIFAVTRAREHLRLKRFQGNYQVLLENRLRETTLLLNDALHNQQDGYLKAIEGIVSAMDVGGHHKSDHSRRVAEYAEYLARQHGLTQPAIIRNLRLAALLHDIGRIAVPEAESLRPDTLNQPQLRLFEKYVHASRDIVMGIPGMAEVAEIVFSCHEHVDGTGLPRKLKADSIPMAARILIVANAFDAWRFDRGTEKGMATKDVVLKINQQAGTWFDVTVVQTFNNCWQELDRLYMQSDTFWDVGGASGDIYLQPHSTSFEAPAR